MLEFASFRPRLKWCTIALCTPALYGWRKDALSACSSICSLSSVTFLFLLLPCRLGCNTTSFRLREQEQWLGCVLHGADYAFSPARRQCQDQLFLSQTHERVWSSCVPFLLLLLIPQCGSRWGSLAWWHRQGHGNMMLLNNLWTGLATKTLERKLRPPGVQFLA